VCVCDFGEIRKIGKKERERERNGRTGGTREKRKESVEYNKHENDEGGR